MKKISLKTFRKSFNLNKSKDESDFMVVQPPSLAGDFGKDDPLFGGCYAKDVAGCGGGGGDDADKGGKGRAKSESLMGTLKRRLSAKQKAKGKGSAAADDAFSSASAPLALKEARAPRPIRSTSLRSHHYSPTPWPLRPTSSEETCVKVEVEVEVEVRVKALVHGSPGPLNGVRKELQPEPARPGASAAPGDLQDHRPDLRLPLDDHHHHHRHQQQQQHRVPVVLGLLPQDYLQYTVPLDDGLCPPEGSPMEVSSGPPGPAAAAASAFAVPEPQGHQELGVAPEIFVDPAAGGLLVGTTGVGLQSPGAGRDDAPPLSPLLPPLQNHPIQRTFGGLAGTEAHVAVAESVRCHLNFDPNTAPGVARVYDSVQSSGPMVVTSLTEELKKLAKQGWYWGPITRWEAEGKLANVPDGSFLVRDSSDDRYLLSLSFRSHGKTLHTRIEHSNGRFSFYEQPDVEGHTSIVDLIEHSIRDSENGAFCYSRSRLPGSATYPVRLTNPVSRFMQVRSLQYLCRFVIRQYTRIDLIQKLPLPSKMKDYLQEKHY